MTGTSHVSEKKSGLAEGSSQTSPLKLTNLLHLTKTMQIACGSFAITKG